MFAIVHFIFKGRAHMKTYIAFKTVRTTLHRIDLIEQMTCCQVDLLTTNLVATMT